MNEPYPKGTKLWDSYWKTVVVVEATGIWTDPGYITGRFYRVKFPGNTVLESHEDSFEPFKNQRPRDERGHFKKIESAT